MITLSPKELASLAINKFGAMQKVGELTDLISAVDMLGHGIKVLEIGVGRGGTSWAWTKMGHAKVVAIDLPDGPWGGGPETSAVEYIQAEAAGEYIYYAGRSNDPQIVAEVKNLGPYDFIFIDGDHSFEGVRDDYNTFRPMARPGAIIAFHDVCEHPAVTQCEVKKFWDELKTTLPPEDFFEIIDEPKVWGGIGLVRVG